MLVCVGSVYAGKGGCTNSKGVVAQGPKLPHSIGGKIGQQAGLFFYFQCGIVSSFQ